MAPFFSNSDLSWLGIGSPHYGPNWVSWKRKMWKVDVIHRSFPHVDSEHAHSSPASRFKGFERLLSRPVSWWQLRFLGWFLPLLVPGVGDCEGQIGELQRLMSLILGGLHTFIKRFTVCHVIYLYFPVKYWTADAKRCWSLFPGIFWRDRLRNVLSVPSSQWFDRSC